MNQTQRHTSDAASLAQRPESASAKPARAAENTPVKARGGGCGSLVLGIVLVLLGIPMLVLPGPGLIAIGAGAALIMRGLGLRRPHT